MRKRIVLLGFAALLFASCVSGSHVTNPSSSASSGWGWRGAGLVSTNLDNGGGFQAIIHVGTRLFVMNARTINNQQACQIFTSVQGSLQWDTIPIPNGLVPNSWFADSQYVYVGMSSHGAVWQLNPADLTWKDMNTGADTIYSVAGLGGYNGGIFASLASSLTTKRPVLFYRAGSWTDLNSSGQFPQSHSFFSGIEYNGSFYAATIDTGLWTWSPSDSQWRMIPNTVSPFDSSVHDGKFPRAMTIFNDSLFVAFYNIAGIEKWLGSTWLREDSCIVANKIANCMAPTDAYTPLDLS